MAKCKWYYKEHEFVSELALDDFLMENARFEPILGDMVFSQTSAQSNVTAQLTTIANDSKALQDKYRQLRREGKILYNADGDESLEAPPYIGVNKFLSTFQTSEGILLFPEFREDEYWKRRFSNWKLGQFNDAEIEEFGLKRDNLPKITDQDQMNKLRQQITQKWEIQAKIGTALHEVLQLFFSKTGDKFNYELEDNDLYTFVMNNVQSSNKQYLNEDAVRETITHGRSLLEELQNRFGENLAFFPEFVISQSTNQLQAGKPLQILGIIDLLVVDSQGRAHIIDYKTSIHSYRDFDNTKKLAYTYQLATYQRMLEKYGINIYSGQMLIAPIQIRNFRRNGDVYIYDGISTSSDIFVETQANERKIWEQINEFMPAPFKLSITTEKLNETVSNAMAKAFPDYSSSRTVTREQVIDELHKYKRLTPDERGLYTYPKYGFKEEPITARSEVEFVNKVLAYKQSLPSTRIRLTGDIKNKIKQAMKDGIDNVSWPTPLHRGEFGSVDWIKDTLKPYCNGSWEVLDNEQVETYGMLILKTKDGIMPPQIDIIRISTNNLTYNYRTKLSSDNPKRNILNLAGQYETDLQQQSKQGTLTVQAYNGNIEIIESAFILNCIQGLDGYTIGNIKVINPYTASSMSLSNEELLWNFKQLCNLGKFELGQNRILDGSLHFATKYEQLLNRYNTIMYEGNQKEWKGTYRNLKGLYSCKSMLDEVLDGSVQDQIEALTKLLKIIEQDEQLSEKVKTVYTSQQDLTENLQLLYNQVLISLANLKGINFRQQVSDHGKILQNMAIHKKGWSGSYIDNPGNLDSETLNLITKLVTEAYQNTRDQMQVKNSKLREMIRKLKDESELGSFAEATIANQASLYSDMIEETPDGDLLFVNPNRLVGAKREFLEYVLQEINKDRFKGCTQEELDEMKRNYSIDYYRVPLALGSDDSIAAARGISGMLREKFRGLIPKVAFERAQQKIEGVLNFDADERNRDSKVLSFWHMTNMFDSGQDTEKRLQTIQKHGIHTFERNLETLLLKHQFAYSVQDNLNKVFPMIKAAAVHLASEGANQNMKFTDDLQYLDEYIKNKVLNKAITDPTFDSIMGFAGILRSAASKFTLAFAPVQALYQPLQGLWQSIRVVITKPNGETSFNFNDYSKALRIVYSDLAHFSDIPSKCEALNELFGINDMDMNVYTQRISNAKKGIWNMENLMFKFASRPDYYNRMTMFVAQMVHDGCFDAVSIKDGKLVYDWKKDSRFSAFANNDKSNMKKYNQQKVLYYQVALQFVKENTKNSDGSTFVLNMESPMALPRVYTNLEAESLKSLADDIYGYYSHEKKSLIQSTAFGCMWLQFKTYWSGKKNQYLQSGGVRLRGNWQQIEQDGQKLFYKVDEQGNPLFDKALTTEDTGMPAMQWNGRWQEGIILTLSEIARNMWNQGSIIKGWESSWNIDPKIAEVRKANLKQFMYEIIMFVLGGCIVGGLLGDWLKEVKEDSKSNKDFAEGLAMAAANVAVMSIKNSFLDFNVFESAGSPVFQWTPFAFEWGSRTWSNWWNVAMGDEDFWDGVVKTSSGLRQIQPVLDSIKPDFWRTEREGGTFGVD